MRAARSVAASAGLDVAGPLALVDVLAPQKCAEPGQVVRAGGGEGIGGGPGEGLRRRGFELEDPRAQHAIARHPLPYPLGHRAQILADDHRAGPGSLQRDQGVQLLGPVGHVGALGRRMPVGDHVHALEAHDVVDAQAVGVLEGAPEGGDEEPVPVFSHALGMQRPETPALPAGEEAVGRRAPLHPRDEGLWGPGGIESVRMGSDGEVCVAAPLVGHRGELFAGHPLGVQVILHRSGVRLAAQ